jgi:hypothetical protein
MLSVLQLDIGWPFLKKWQMWKNTLKFLEPSIILQYFVLAIR